MQCSEACNACNCGSLARASSQRMGDLGYQGGEPSWRQAQPVPAIPANDPCLSLPSDLPQGLPMGWTQQKPVSKRAPGGADSGVEKSGKCMQRSKGADSAKPPPSSSTQTSERPNRDPGRHCSLGRRRRCVEEFATQPELEPP